MEIIRVILCGYKWNAPIRIRKFDIQWLTDLWWEDVDLVDLEMEGPEASAFVESLGNCVNVIVSQNKLSNKESYTHWANSAQTSTHSCTRARHLSIFALWLAENMTLASKRRQYTLTSCSICAYLTLCKLQRPNINTNKVLHTTYTHAVQHALWNLNNTGAVCTSG